MPFIIAAFALVGLLIYGAVRLYALVAAAYGAVAGGAAVLMAVALLACALMFLIRRYRAVHGVNVKGERIVSLSGSWGRSPSMPNRSVGRCSCTGRAPVFSLPISPAPMRSNAKAPGRWCCA